MGKPAQEGFRRYPKTEGWFTPNLLARLWFAPLRAPCICIESFARPSCKGRCGCDACLSYWTQRYFEMSNFDLRNRSARNNHILSMA